MKRIVLSIVVLLVLLCGIAVAEEVTIVASGDCGASGSSVTWTLDSEGTLTISGAGKMSNYSSSGNVPWYAERTSIKTAVIEAGVTSIGNSAFRDCNKLSSVDLPEGVTSIGSDAFYGCSSLTSVDLPASLTKIGEYAFYNCSSLNSITIPVGVTGIGRRAFQNCSSLSSITIPEGVTVIGDYVFQGCSSLSSIDLPEGVTGIGYSAFYGCSSLSSIDIPDSVTSIDRYAFYGCSCLSSITIPEGVTVIGEQTFYCCSSLRSVDLPDSLTRISYYAFSRCSSLSSIDIPDSVTSIDGYAFQDCSSLSSITIPVGVTGIGRSAFQNCSSLSSVTIPEGVTGIGDSAFYGCSSLSSITIPEGVTGIGDDAFWGCSSLSSVDLPDSLTRISFRAFYNCSSLSSITFPDGVASIGNGAFSGCSSLSSITLPAGLTSVGSNTFYECSSLTSIDLPAGVTSIGDYAFYGCSSLTSIDLPAGVTSIGDSAFEICSSLTSIDLPAGVTSIGKYAFQYCYRLSSVTIPASVTEIGWAAFRYSYGLDRVMFLGNDMPTMSGFVFTFPPVVYCYEFSDVDFWATEEGYTCVYIDDMDLSKPISIDLPKDMRIEKGEIITISAGLFPQTATAEIVWQSSDPSVVSVENGVLTAKAVGEATITASCEGLSDQMVVVVYAPLESFELSEKELWVVSKETAQLDIRDIEPVDATASFTWESSDTSVLTVDSGKITVLKPGDATVTVTSDNSIVRTCLVHVCYPVTAIELEQSEYQMITGADAQITAHVTTRDQSFVNRFVNFASSNEAVATVDSMGCIHAVSPGTATVTVSATNGISAACSVTVASCIHTPVTDPAVPATHVTTGLTEGSHCSICDEVLVAQQVIPIVEVEKLVLPAELETIEAEAFAGGSMVCVVIPEGCRAIGAGAFRNCAQLRFVEVPASVTTIDGSAFDGRGDLIIVAASGSVAEDFAQTYNITCVTYPQNG